MPFCKDIKFKIRNTFPKGFKNRRCITMRDCLRNVSALNEVFDKQDISTIQMK